MSRQVTYRRVRRDVINGWWAEAGVHGSLPFSASRMTKTGARWAAWRMERRLQRGER